MIGWGKVGRALRARRSDGSENRPYLDAARSARSADPTRCNWANRIAFDVFPTANTI